jgi:hypothetical protein
MVVERVQLKENYEIWVAELTASTRDSALGSSVSVEGPAPQTGGVSLRGPRAISREVK